MSELTYTLLIKCKPKEGRSAFKKLNREGFFFPMNDSWTALILKDGINEGETISKFLSDVQNTLVLNYIYCEDYYWNVSLFNSGKLLSHIYLDFDNNEIDVYNPEELLTLSQENKKIEQINDLIFVEKHNPIEIINFFKQRFGFNDLEWISFDYINDWDTNIIKKRKVQPITKRQSKMKTFSDLIMKNFSILLLESGFNFIETNEEGYIIFEKIINGFSYQIQFNILEKNTITFMLAVPNSGMLLLQEDENLVMLIPYNGVSEMKKIIIDKGEDFCRRSLKYIEENPINIYELNSTYKKEISNFLQNYGFNLLKIDNDILHGGEAWFSRKDLILIFRHPKGSTIVEAFFREKRINNRISFSYILNSDLKLFNLPNFRYTDFPFKDNEEFMSQINRLLSYLINYLEKEQYQLNI